MLVEVNVDRRGISRKQECWKNLGDDKKPFIIKLKWVVGSEDYDNFDSDNNDSNNNNKNVNTRFALKDCIPQF